MDFSPKVLRARYAELTKIAEAAEAKLAPLHQALTEHVASYTDKELAIRAKIKKVKDDANLYDIEMERAAIARALGGKTAEPAEPAEPATE